MLYLIHLINNGNPRIDSQWRLTTWSITYCRFTVLIQIKACLMRFKLALWRKDAIKRYSVYESFLRFLSDPPKIFSHSTLVVMQNSQSITSSLDGNRSDGFSQIEGAHRKICITLAATSGASLWKRERR